MVIASAPTMRPLALAVRALLVGCADDTPYRNCGGNEPCGGGTYSQCFATETAAVAPATHGISAQFCTKRCATPGAVATAADECPANSACLSINGSDPVCIKLCTTNADCTFTNGACVINAGTMGAHICSVRP